MKLIILLFIPLLGFSQTKEEVLEYCKEIGIKHAEIVTAQAILETGHFKHVPNNNLFGLYDSNACGYFCFDNWKQSVEAYKRMIQDKYYKGGDYYDFLNCMWKGDTGKCKSYAQSENYTDTLKMIRV